jgi:hypothetical protein
MHKFLSQLTNYFDYLQYLNKNVNLRLAKSEKHLYCSGIDPAIVQLDYVTVNESENYKSWIKSNVFYNHTHDVRSLIIANNQLISAGVDTKIVFKSIDDKQRAQQKLQQKQSGLRKYSSMSQVNNFPILFIFIYKRKKSRKKRI